MEYIAYTLLWHMAYTLLPLDDSVTISFAITFPNIFFHSLYPAYILEHL